MTETTQEVKNEEPEIKDGFTQDVDIDCPSATCDLATWIAPMTWSMDTPAIPAIYHRCPLCETVGVAPFESDEDADQKLRDAVDFALEHRPTRPAPARAVPDQVQRDTHHIADAIYRLNEQLGERLNGIEKAIYTGQVI